MAASSTSHPPERKACKAISAVPPATESKAGTLVRQIACDFLLFGFSGATSTLSAPDIVTVMKNIPPQSRVRRYFRRKMFRRLIWSNRISPPGERIRAEPEPAHHEHAGGGDRGAPAH